MAGPLRTVEAEPAAEQAEDLIPGLRLNRLLARGGFAEVWEAEQISLGRRVAAKILRHEHLDHPQMVQLFEQESRVLARLNHPNLVQVIDRGASEQGPYFVMEFVEGQTFQELISRGTLGRERALSILLQTARGLAYAHRNGIVHRDIKPANVLVGRSGQIKLSDFGIAAVKAAADKTEEDDAGTNRRALGTRAFMAPEQRTSFDDVGPEADVYSLGVILHRIITGKLPEGPGRVAKGVRIPERLLPIIEKALASSPGRRHPHAGAFREALVIALEGRHLDDRIRRGAASALGSAGRFELLDVIRQDERRSVYLVRKGGADGERIVVKRYRKDPEALKVVRQLIRVDHPNIVRIHAVGERDDAFIMLMEHLSGGDLRERLVKPHPWREALSIAREVTQALVHAAKFGIVHGNLRPSNVLFDEAGRVRVTDFGLPEHYRGEAGKRNWYAAPEGTGGPQADIYAVGAIVYEMLMAAAVPEDQDDLFRDAYRSHAIPDKVKTVISKMLAPADVRYGAVEHVLNEVEHLLGEETRAGQSSVVEDIAPAATNHAASVDARRPAYGAALIGLGGLLFVWALNAEWVQNFLVNFFAGS